MLITELTGQVETHLSEFEHGQKLHTQVIPHFKGLQQAAKQIGFNLQIASGFRSFERQSLIWNNKYSGRSIILDKDELPLNTENITELKKLLAILHWSALPGTSRHHWGTDFDIFDPELLPIGQKLQLTKSEYLQDYFLEFNLWVTENMANYGFYRPYQCDNGGVAIEPWHISYYPIANDALNDLQINDIDNLIMQSNLLGKSLISLQLPMIYKQFICNVNQQFNGV